MFRDFAHVRAKVLRKIFILNHSDVCTRAAFASTEGYSRCPAPSTDG